MSIIRSLAAVIRPALVLGACAVSSSDVAQSFRLLAVNSHPLPYAEYSLHEGRQEILNETESGLLELFRDSARFTTVNRPSYLAHFPCEGLRLMGTPPDTSVGGTLVQVRDTTTKGCDALRLETYALVLSRAADLVTIEPTRKTILRFTTVIRDSTFLRDTTGTYVLDHGTYGTGPNARQSPQRQSQGTLAGDTLTLVTKFGTPTDSNVAVYVRE